MKASDPATVAHFLRSRDEIARYELADKVGVIPCPRFFDVIAQIRQLPAKIELNREVIMPHLYPYLLQHQKAYASYAGLCAGIEKIAKMIGQTSCTLQFTQLVNGLYAGSPTHLHALWSRKTKELPANLDGLGTKFADVKFLY